MVMASSSRLRWKKHEKVTGLARICAGQIQAAVKFARDNRVCPIVIDGEGYYEIRSLVKIANNIGKTSLISAIIEQYGGDGYLEFLASVKAEIEAEKANG